MSPFKIASLSAALLLLCSPLFAGSGVLIVADEMPAMELLAGKLKAAEGLASDLVLQTALPADLTRYGTVIVYIHKGLDEAAERAFIGYAEGGGKLLVLHHSISSGKRKNKDWFPFLGVALPQGGVNEDGYQWQESITLDLVNLAPEHFITTHQVQYPARIAYGHSPDAEKQLPGFTLPDSEVYLNHVLSGPRTPLLGLRFADPKSGQVWMQGHAGWVRPAGKGWAIYLMPGHSALDFENPAYARIVMNAVIWKP